MLDRGMVEGDLSTLRLNKGMVEGLEGGSAFYKGFTRRVSEIWPHPERSHQANPA